MFTGLIQAIGTIRRQGPSALQVHGCSPFEPLQIGESIAVDGVCLTVSAIKSGGFIADISEETLSRTSLGLNSERGGFVNLEPALRFSDRLGGHLVSGHVDGIGKVISIRELESSWNLDIEWQDRFFGRYMCEKASIALNGISLTVARCKDQGCNFSIAVIPHTWNQTSLKYLSIGDVVNLEVDIMAKYAENLLRVTSKDEPQENNFNDEISTEWLKDQGWT